MLEREIQTINKQYDWPENFYMETDPFKRKDFLDEALAADPSKENQFRQLLWQKRYADSKGNVTGSDHFLKLWTDLPFVEKQKKSLFSKRLLNNFLKEWNDIFQWETLKENPDYRDIWLKEFINFCCFYIQISKTDKTYSTTLFGIGKLSDDTLARKMANDLYQKTVILPGNMNLLPEENLLEEAAKSSFELYFPTKAALCEEVFSGK